MIKKEKHYKLPSENKLLWHYMSLEKFVDLLQTQSLYFCNAQRLKDEDPFEGAFTEKEKIADMVERKNEYNVINKLGITELLNPIINRYYIFCWNMNAHESMAMWKMYTNVKTGILFATTLKHLKKCFRDNGISVKAGKVIYRNFYNFKGKRTPYPKKYLNQNFLLRKNNCYKYEKEFRLIYKDNQENDKKKREKIYGGIRMKINLEDLLEKIVLAPCANEDYAKNINSLIKLYSNLHDINIPYANISNINKNFIEGYNYKR